MNEEPEYDTDGMDKQRQALEDMSQALLDKLNAMVREQDSRAQAFAQHTHSLSALPGAPELLQTPPLPELPKVQMPQMPQTPPVGEAAGSAQAERRAQVGGKVADRVPPLVRKVAQPVADTPPHRRTPQPAPARPVKKKDKEGSINVGTLVFAGFILFALLRSCN